MEGPGSAGRNHQKEGLFFQGGFLRKGPRRLNADPYQQLCVYWQSNIRLLRILQS